MTLQNLAKIGQLKPHKATAEEVARLLAAVRRNLADAEVKGISNETRFDCGYKAVMQCALIAMMASGYRPSTSAPGRECRWDWQKRRKHSLRRKHYCQPCSPTYARTTRCCCSKRFAALERPRCRTDRLYAGNSTFLEASSGLAGLLARF